MRILTKSTTRGLTFSAGTSKLPHANNATHLNKPAGIMLAVVPATSRAASIVAFHPLLVKTSSVLPCWLLFTGSTFTFTESPRVCAVQWLGSIHLSPGRRHAELVAAAAVVLGMYLLFWIIGSKLFTVVSRHSAEGLYVGSMQDDHPSLSLNHSTD